jgi:hypothetical protein
MHCFRENSNFPFSNQKIITLKQVAMNKNRFLKISLSDIF